MTVFLMHRLALAASTVVMCGQVFAVNGELKEAGTSQHPGTSNLKMFDVDGDGKVSLDEIMGVLSPSPLEESEHTSEQDLETDTLTRDFYNAAVPTLFEQVDDGDGFLSAGEILVFLHKLDEAYVDSGGEL
eukprot:TRINITY_DN7374_c0_g1_i1.p1 TRINITY_DN7374_c0_g1~~TRINITY_DN7374_c0_g1_i1.p1  ORF type:complete len:131 (-),score=27.49 TRINITY_DN7374_c0_g1_i1:36-428(-)